MKKPIIFHIPHSSTYIPCECRSGILLDDEALEKELYQMTDRWTNDLFARPDTHACMVNFPVSRLICDPERFREDEQEAMSVKGMGAVYSRTSDGKKLRNLDLNEREQILCRYYDAHHARLSSEVKTMLENFGRCVIVDGHSFSAAPLPYEDDKAVPRPDFCIGTDEYHTPPELIKLCASHLRRKGYTVAINKPYAGALVPIEYYRKDKRVKSVMIEANRGLYMDSNGKTTAYCTTKRNIQELLILVESWAQKMLLSYCKDIPHIDR